MKSTELKSSKARNITPSTNNETIPLVESSSDEELENCVTQYKQKQKDKLKRLRNRIRELKSENSKLKVENQNLKEANDALRKEIAEDHANRVNESIVSAITWRKPLLNAQRQGFNNWPLTSTPMPVKIQTFKKPKRKPSHVSSVDNQIEENIQPELPPPEPEIEAPQAVSIPSQSKQSVPTTLMSVKNKTSKKVKRKPSHVSDDKQVEENIQPELPPEPEVEVAQASIPSKSKQSVPTILKPLKNQTSKKVKRKPSHVSDDKQVEENIQPAELPPELEVEVAQASIPSKSKQSVPTTLKPVKNKTSKKAKRKPSHVSSDDKQIEENIQPELPPPEPEIEAPQASKFKQLIPKPNGKYDWRRMSEECGHNLDEEKLPEQYCCTCGYTVKKKTIKNRKLFMHKHIKRRWLVWIKKNITAKKCTVLLTRLSTSEIMKGKPEVITID